jgi:hypothetical protein
MNAADGIQALERRAMRSGNARLILIAAAVFLTLGVTWCGGRSHGIAQERGRTVDSVRRVLRDSSIVIEKRLAARAPVLAAADTHATVARRAYAAAADTFRAHVTVIDSNTVRIDGGPPVHEIPVSLALPPIQACAPAIAADTVLHAVVVAQLADMTEDRDTWRARALLDEANTPHPSRIGFKSGVATGAIVVALLVHLLR